MSWTLSKFIRDNRRTYPKRTKDHTMKFSTLEPSVRTLLAALCNASNIRTDRLANCINCTPQEAANVLCKMRKLGLIYSMEKGSAAYAPWSATEVGMHLFSNRPDHTLVYVNDAELNMLESLKANGGTAQPITRYVVATNFDLSKSGTKKQAMLAAEEMALRVGQPVTVLGLVAQMTPPEQPKVQIELL